MANYTPGDSTPRTRREAEAERERYIKSPEGEANAREFERLRVNDEVRRLENGGQVDPNDPYSVAARRKIVEKQASDTRRMGGGGH